MRNLFSRKDLPFGLYEVDILSASPEELQKMSDDAGLALNVEEMHRIKSYFKSKGRNPTDVELQSLGQAWSEHCCYKSSKVFLKEYLVSIESDDVIDRGDAGVVDFDEEHAYAIRIESHNHPSAVEPYGGAATGIGGIIRDVLCMGAQPIALIDPLHFGPLDFRYRDLPAGVKHPRYLMGGVVAGIRDYGNRLGIPTVSGAVLFDEGYIGNCIINVGCVGIAKKKNLARNRVKTESDVFILVGGRTGRDGIHGVTFASVELTEDMEEEWRGGAVQLGDPILKEPLIHACLEAAERGLLNGMKDLGGGGLSCVVGEMALAGGFGAEVDLEKVPLKEEGLLCWEIWVSESQERMMLAVDPKNVEKVLHIFKLYDVLATPIGHVIHDKIVRVKYQGQVVLELDLEFLTAGPEYCRPFVTEFESMNAEETSLDEPENYEDTLLGILSSQNVSSKDWVIRQYDHEIRASTILKPLQGKIGLACHGDAVVMKPLEHSNKSLAITTATTPQYTAINPYLGGASAMDEMCRNLVAVGGKPHSFSNCLNFGNPEKPDRLGAFRETVRGIGEMASELGLPVPSGNVSFYNETSFAPVKPTPVILGIGIVEDFMRCVTSDFKKEGNLIYLVGETRKEMGGSEYYSLRGAFSPAVPTVEIDVLKRSMSSILSSINKGLIRSCHDISHGGLAVALSEMCLGGDLGANVDLSTLGDLRFDFKLFSESNTRWLLEVDPDNEEEILRRLDGLSINRIGEVSGKEILFKDNGRRIKLSLNDVRKAWTDTLTELMGGMA
ncbi:MAG: phosphoribosylformylglycinamidine synthase subunit PurL [Methanobacteriota archaeon]|nr:MAG: phosphoribosylformylglycinamidine synthase subunit PurL [Euryarchaeota archaeon]